MNGALTSPHRATPDSSETVVWYVHMYGMSESDDYCIESATSFSVAEM